MTNKCEHIELATTHPDRAKTFYSKLLGWKIQAMPNPDGHGEYLMFQTANGGGGITAKMAPEQPTAWTPYITVDSVKSTIKSAVKLGADTVMDYTPIGDMGAIAVLRDPTGATFGLWETAKPAKKVATKKPSKPASKKRKKG